MGSKTPANKETRHVECELCHRSFFSLHALRTHQAMKHPAKEKGIEAKSLVTSRVSKRLQMKKDSDGEADKSENENVTTKTEFACPICQPQKIYPYSFQAVKHVEKKHCKEKATMTPEELKPVPVEIPIPTVESPPVNVGNSYNCLGCEKSFATVALFNNHVEAFHRDSLDIMFFKSNEEFTMWQHKMQNHVRIKYVSLHSQTTMKHYQCNFVSPKNEFNKTYLCPSAVMAKEMSKGIQVCYSMKHYGHKCPEYEIPKEFTQYLTNKVSDSSTKSQFDELILKKEPDCGLHLKLSNLLRAILDDAETLSPGQLKKLFNAALELQAVMNSFDEDDNEKGLLDSKNMTDDQITEILGEKEDITDVIEGNRDQITDSLEVKRASARLKRKSVTNTNVEVKKKKAGDENDKAKENKERGSPKAPIRSSPLMSPSFVDSYRQFVDTALQVGKTTPQTKAPRKEILKTKMGQFTPSPEKKIKKVDSDDIKPSVLTLLKSEPQRTKTPSKKPSVVKPAKTKALKSISNDFQYEVIEQENDCNILVLKI